MIRKRRKSNKLLINIVNILLVAVIVASLFILLTTVLTPRGQAPSIAGFAVFIVLTGSMEPEIPVDSLIVTAQTPPEQIKTGDVISFYFYTAGEQAVNTHRVIEIESENGEYTFRTRGDANYSDDPYEVEESDIIGKVVFSSYLIGRIISFMRQKYVFMAVILIPLAAVIIIYVIKLLRITREEIRRAGEEIEEEQKQINARTRQSDSRDDANNVNRDRRK